MNHKPFDKLRANGGFYNTRQYKINCVLGVLKEGAGAVFLVSYNEPIAGFYPVPPFNLNAENTCALTLPTALTGEGLPMQFSRSSMTRDDGEQPIQSVAFLRILLAEDKSLSLGNREQR